MTVYHGSTIAVEKPQILPSNRMLDLYNQILFHTNKSLNYCNYVRHKRVQEYN